MVYKKLTEYVNGQEWGAARQELERIQETDFDDVIAILAASICFQEGKEEEAYDYICRGITCNYENYELYLLLGNYYENKNVNQAWLCYENAEFYCKDAADKEIIRQYKSRVELSEDWNVRNVSIVILSYNLQEICRQCIASIRNNNTDITEIVVVDNASTDGIVEWLKEQKDVILVCNQTNRGFPCGCNQGIKASKPDNDILLLNNDTEVLPNSIFWLRMGLYSDSKIGATGSMSNFAGNQQAIVESFHTIEEYRAYGLRNNVPMRNAYEKKTWLVGFAMLIRRTALDEVGLLDLRFSPGGFEDDDIGVRMQNAGWRLLLCHNSFIIHYGSGAEKNRAFWDKNEKTNAEKFKNKWGFDIQYYTWSRMDLIACIEEPKDKRIKVLEIGCGCGATLSKIEYLWPKADVYGIEFAEAVAKIGANCHNVVHGDIETMELPYEKGYFDYIILGNVLEHLYAPERVIKHMGVYLNEKGKFLCSILNVMHESVLLALLKGTFTYEDTGILDRMNIRFFTLNSIVQMFCECGFCISHLRAFTEQIDKGSEDQELLDAFYQLPHLAKKELFQTYQYIFTAQRR